MPSAEAVERFIQGVLANEYVRTIAEFYTDNATMRENQDAPRRGRNQLMAGEQTLLDRATSAASDCVRPVFINGDHVVIRWKFRFVWRDRSVTEMEEIACQRWEGERIAEEQFFYDPAQRAPKPAIG